MKPLGPPDRLHLETAQGWLELGNHGEATEELARIAPQMRAHPEVLKMRYEICAGQELGGRSR
jgi:hypothetical protein